MQSKGRREAGKRRNAITVTTDSDERTNERTNEQLGKFALTPPPSRPANYWKTLEFAFVNIGIAPPVWWLVPFVFAVVYWW